MNIVGTWAGSCYGWMRVSGVSSRNIKAILPTHDLSRWAIVKQDIPQTTTASDVPSTYNDFSIAKRAGMLPGNIEMYNYRGSQIVDLSSTLRYPCPKGDSWSFNFFYEVTIDGVFDWFSDQTTQQTAASLSDSTASPELPSPMPPPPPPHSTPSSSLVSSCLFLLAGTSAGMLYGSLVFKRCGRW